mmetsp:Transcript_7966/g.24468  ORF Transcript_7966/g.24468 Transcript_7966/m.24468 type:complete len:296 (+) Transcript_7966:653-1540(+)
MAATTREGGASTCRSVRPGSRVLPRSVGMSFSTLMVLCHCCAASATCPSLDGAASAFPPCLLRAALLRAPRPPRPLSVADESAGNTAKGEMTFESEPSYSAVMAILSMLMPPTRSSLMRTNASLDAPPLDPSALCRTARSAGAHHSGEAAVGRSKPAHWWKVPALKSSARTTTPPSPASPAPPSASSVASVTSAMAYAESCGRISPTSIAIDSGAWRRSSMLSKLSRARRSPGITPSSARRAESAGAPPVPAAAAITGRRVSSSWLSSCAAAASMLSTAASGECRQEARTAVRRR